MTFIGKDSGEPSCCLQCYLSPRLVGWLVWSVIQSPVKSFLDNFRSVYFLKSGKNNFFTHISNSKIFLEFNFQILLSSTNFNLK